MFFYRDHADEYVIRDFPFENDMSSVQKNLNRQSANGGGDFEEAVEVAVENAVEQKNGAKMRWHE